MHKASDILHAVNHCLVFMQSTCSIPQVNLLLEKWSLTVTELDMKKLTNKMKYRLQ
jgi:hypothetical protein